MNTKFSPMKHIQVFHKFPPEMPYTNENKYFQLSQGL